MTQAELISFIHDNQELLWFGTIVLDLGCALIMFRIFGKQGLYGTVVISLLLANIQGPKLTEIFGLQTSMGVILYSSIYFATDLLSERYGKREAARAVLIGFSVSVIILIMTSISLLYLPSTNSSTAGMASSMHEATATLFDYSPRFVIGSLLAYLISQSFDVWIFHYIKNKTAGKHLWLRNNVSTIISQGLDTLIYGLVVWWGVVDFKTAIALALSKYIFKVVIAVIDTPFIYMARRWDVDKVDRMGQNN